ncbi:GNAT family N-acetyltransferase [Spirosoma sordidisoli]|uniref:GNAT family N-acetyltransferase n=1 Tax=Spirosoma sordidisoli TaxID=2502893 RepID=A0A4Q2UXY8_9BACT|nr:GNAT family N-acetyltransferase [Spirosoma sordidisoli]RYC71939.1 GNAT family N-acetyltransferase [Spirosoma sordidisoli]
MPYRIELDADLHAPTRWPYAEDGFFFNTPEHVRQQHPGTGRTVLAVNTRTGRAEARCTFFVDGNQARSPAAAPFGSVEFTDTLPDTALGDFLDTLLAVVSASGVSRFRLVNYPHDYAPRQAQQLTEQLTRRGFGIVSTTASYLLPITDDPFDTRIDASERRRLQKCRNAGFRFEHWPNPDIDRVTAFLVSTRQQQGYALSLPPEQLGQLLRTFPNQFLVFVVSDTGAVAALTIAVRVRADILYSFLPASSPDYHTFSPMVLLIDGLVGYCRQQQIRLLDLGVSLDGDHQPKPSLSRFKRRLGAQESPRLTFEKQF